jgi:hypothetical protein
MDSHAANFDPILKENKETLKNANLRKEFFYVFYYPGKISNPSYDNSL